MSQARFSKLDLAIQQLNDEGQGCTLLAEEQVGGTMQYILFQFEDDSFEYYESSRTKLHSVNFSCLAGRGLSTIYRLGSV